MKNKWILFLFIWSFLFISCVSYYRIDDQKTVDNSLLIMLLNIPDNFRIVDASIHDQSGKIYESNYRGKFGSELKNKLIIFSNIPAGKYRLHYFYSVSNPTSKVINQGLLTSFYFWNITFVDKAGQDYWINVKPGTVHYAGKIYWEYSAREAEFYEKILENENMSLTQLSFGKLYETDLNIQTNEGVKPYPGFIFQYDHPEVIGKKKGLELNKAILSYLKRDKLIPGWHNAIDKQLKEIDLELSTIK